MKKTVLVLGHSLVNKDVNMMINTVGAVLVLGHSLVNKDVGPRKADQVFVLVLGHSLVNKRNEVAANPPPFLY